MTQEKSGFSIPKYHPWTLLLREKSLLSGICTSLDLKNIVKIVRFPFVLRKIENSVEVSKSMVNFALFERAVQELLNEQKIFEKALVVAELV